MPRRSFWTRGCAECDAPIGRSRFVNRVTRADLGISAEYVEAMARTEQPRSHHLVHGGLTSGDVLTGLFVVVTRGA